MTAQRLFPNGTLPSSAVLGAATSRAADGRCIYHGYSQIPLYVHRKEAESLNGPARIGRVSLSKTGRTFEYRGQKLQRQKGGYKWNYVETGDHYWISGSRRDGKERLYLQSRPVEIDGDVREEYWTKICRMPEAKKRTSTAPICRRATSRPRRRCPERKIDIAKWFGTPRARREERLHICADRSDFTQFFQNASRIQPARLNR
jgi:hypothetical protein